MMKQMMKKAMAMMTAGVMAMTVCGSTVWASDDSSEKGIEGWEVVGDITCTPIDEYEGTLDKDAPSAGYVLDLRLVNSDVVEIGCNKL